MEVIKSISFWVVLGVVSITLTSLYLVPDQADKIVPVALAGLFGVAQGMQRFRTLDNQKDGGTK